MSCGKSVRLRLYPQGIASCSKEAVAYASCVACKDDIKKNDCNPEFEKLKTCFQKNMKNLIMKKS
ncbi:unnamed protein product [Larinioides sclopetarius]|uniref:Uncharacterized protein n=1 Tax=Larinioides sclopetarius TaxID=280406 RepID=A0AAV2ADU2_9ARAC